MVDATYGESIKPSIEQGAKGEKGLTSHAMRKNFYFVGSVDIIQEPGYINSMKI